MEPTKKTACMERVASIIGHPLSKDEEQSLYSFVGRGSGITQWNTKKLRKKILQWQSERFDHTGKMYYIDLININITHIATLS
jgi:hypothetical protein